MDKKIPKTAAGEIDWHAILEEGDDQVLLQNGEERYCLHRGRLVLQEYGRNDYGELVSRLVLERGIR